MQNSVLEPHFSSPQQICKCFHSIIRRNLFNFFSQNMLGHFSQLNYEKNCNFSTCNFASLYSRTRVRTYYAHFLKDLGGYVVLRRGKQADMLPFETTAKLRFINLWLKKYLNRKKITLGSCVEKRKLGWDQVTQQIKYAQAKIPVNAGKFTCVPNASGFPRDRTALHAFLL